MSSYDDIFVNRQTQKQTENHSFVFAPQGESGAAARLFDKDAWAESKQAERGEVYEMMDAATVKTLSDGKDFCRFLDTMSRFDRYSAGNILLIMTQNPDATKLRDFESWKDSGVNIKKNEKGIRILEPSSEYTREDGTTGISYNIKRVFDISQTTAIKPARQPDKIDPNELRKTIGYLTKSSPVAVSISDNLPDGIGAEYVPGDSVIYIRRGMDGGDILRSLSNEIAHAGLHLQNGKYNRAEASFPAYCASYAICKKAGVDVGSFSFDRLPNEYAGMEPQEGRAELSQIRNLTADIIEKMDAQKERQQEKARNQPER